MKEISEVLQKFDFKQVHEYIVWKQLPWWIGKELTWRVPTLEEVIEDARRCLNLVYNRPTYIHIISNGFRARKTGDELILSYQLTETAVPYTTADVCSEPK